jgi:hypothetical protein
MGGLVLVCDREYAAGVRTVRGRVVGNTIVMEDAAMFREGAEVSVTVDEGGWELDAESRMELDAAQESVRLGRGIPVEQVLTEMRAALRK